MLEDLLEDFDLDEFEEEGENGGGGYLGNPLLKKVGEPVEWTPERLQEFLKCKNDPIYFAEKYIKIVHVDHGLIPIKLYEYQKEIINAITFNRRVVVNSSRQSGKTTSAAAIVLHYILFNQRKTVALLSNKRDSALEIMDRVQLSYQNLPKWIQQGVKEWNKGSLSLENGCKVIAASSSASSIRGKAIAFLYIDETAFLDNWEDFYSSVYPTISSGKQSKILLTSTPKGLNHFHKICHEASSIPEGVKKHSEDDFLAGENGFIYIEVKWDRVPGRDEEWKNDTLASMGGNLDQFAQEFNCSFMGSSDTLLSSQALSNLTAKKTIYQTDHLKQYHNPIRDRIYTIVADTSRGKGLDYSAFSVIDVTSMPYQQVCSYRCNTVSPNDYAVIIKKIAEAYNNAMVLIELNDLGSQVSDCLWMDLGYENVLSTVTKGRSGKKVGRGSGKNKAERGITTSEKVKRVGCSILKLLIEQEQLIINDADTIHELKRFSKKNDSYAAEKGAHDDTVMPLVLFAWLSDQGHFKNITDIDTLENLRDMSDEDVDEGFTGFMFSSNHDEESYGYWQPVSF